MKQALEALRRHRKEHGHSCNIVLCGDGSGRLVEWQTTPLSKWRHWGPSDNPAPLICEALGYEYMPEKSDWERLMEAIDKRSDGDTRYALVVPSRLTGHSCAMAVIPETAWAGDDAIAWSIAGRHDCISDTLGQLQTAQPPATITIPRADFEALQTQLASLQSEVALLGGLTDHGAEKVEE